MHKGDLVRPAVRETRASHNHAIEVGLTRSNGECQRHQTQREAKCQDINVDGKQWRKDDSGCGYSGDDGGTTDGGDRTQQQRHNDTNHNLHLHQENEVSYKLVPPDGGWGWMVVLGTFIIATLLPSLGPCFGVLFSGYLLEEGSSSTNTAWIFNLQCFLWFISGLLTRPLTEEFGWRPVALSGSLMGCLGLTISAFTPNPNFLFFSFSVMTGIGGGIVTCQCFTILPHYFERLRGLTNAFMMSGICMGQFILPPVARYLQDNYGFRGATLIIGALMLHACIGASFFHPYEWHQKTVPVEEEEEEQVTSLPKTTVTDLPHLTRELVPSPSKSSFIGSTGKAECDGNLAAKARLLGRLEGWKPSSSSSRQSSRYNSTLSLSSMDVGSLATMLMDDEQEKAHMKAHRAEGEILPIRVMKSIIRDLRALTSLRVCIFCFGAIMSINGFLNFLMMVPFALQEAGLSKDTAAWCVSVSAICNLVTRFIVSSLSDYQWFNKRLAYKFGFLFIACFMFTFTLVNTAGWLLAVMAVYGSSVGASMGIYNIVIIDVMGVERLAPVFGATNFCVAIGFICSGPLIGFVRDVTQSYAISIRITAGMLLLGLTAWMFMGVAERIDRRREAAKTTEEA